MDNVLPFWQRHSLDKQHGGYITCLDRQGKTYDTDKFMWLQGRQLWTFSSMYNRLERRREWLEAARLGADFLRKHGRDREGNWYFSLLRDGTPTVDAYNIFSDAFACMGFAQYGLATGDAQCKQIAIDTYHNILRRQPNPKGRWSKAMPGARPLKSIVLPMILLNLTLEMESLLEPAECDRVLDASLDQVMNLNVDKKRLITFENVMPDGSHADCLDGRIVSPGHGIEAMWFVMDVARRRGDQAMIERACDVVLALLEFGWDKKFDGLFYFLDAQGHPPDRLDWDQKLWWVHLETLVALLMGYNLTGRPALWKWFEKIHNYTWPRFSDPKFGEWYGYLNRRGEVSLSLKGGKWKGCFHVPRALYLCYRELQTLNHTRKG